MLAADEVKRRFNLGAVGVCIRTAGSEPASGRRIHRAWYIPFQDDPLGMYMNIGNRDRTHQRLCVRMKGSIENLLFGADLDNLSKVHDRDLIAEKADD